MFDNIGNKIKSLVKTIFAIEFVLFIIIVLVFSNTPVGLIVGVSGIFLAWVSSFVLYGFGELIDNSQKQTKQNEVIISLLSTVGNDDADEPVNLKPQASRIKTSNSTGFSAIKIPQDK